MSECPSGMLAPVSNERLESTRLAAVTRSHTHRREKRAADDDLVARCRRGDLGAFEAIYRRHSTSVFNLAYRLVGNATDAEDLLQEIFLLAFNKLLSFHGQAAFGTWLYRVATNRCLDHLRSKARRNQSMTESLDETAPASASPPMESTADRLDLERCISRLPDSYRAAFLLYDVEGFDHREVAEILGVAEGTSKSLVHKARLKIRAYFGHSQNGARQ